MRAVFFWAPSRRTKQMVKAKWGPQQGDRDISGTTHTLAGIRDPLKFFLLDNDEGLSDVMSIFDHAFLSRAVPPPAPSRLARSLIKSLQSWQAGSRRRDSRWSLTVEP